jgi:gas vesicle structural protein
VKRKRSRPKPRKTTLPPLARHTTVPAQGPRLEPRRPKLAPRAQEPRAARHETRWKNTTAPRRDVARLIDPDEATLLDVVDNMLNRGVVINADVILALANVDLVYLRLSALLCAADRVLRPARR